LIREYSIVDKVGFFVGDNAANNDTTFITSLGKYLQKTIPSSCRIRCAGHIINLVVKASIYGAGVSKWEQKVAKAAPLEQFQLYREKGVVGKLHNFVNSIYRSFKRKELFDSLQKIATDSEDLFDFQALQLIKDGGVRWNSVYLMVRRSPLLCLFKRY
jgi:hypothetical protein